MSQDEQDLHTTRFPGHEFTQAREGLQFSIEQVSNELHLPIKVIKAIESGNPQSFHNPVFIRGYIRTYAKHLGLDAAHYANLYASLPGVDLQPVTIKSTTSVKERDPSKSPFMKIFTWLFLLAIIAIIIWWAGEQSGRSPFTSNHNTSSAESSEVMPPEEIQVAEHFPTPSIITVPEEAVLQDDSAPVELEADMDVHADEGVVEEETGQQSDHDSSQASTHDSGLFMSFSGDCWVQVRDANDVQLYSGVASGGSELHLEGELPISLVIGRREAVSEITFNGEEIDLASLTTGSVARFSVPLR